MKFNEDKYLKEIEEYIAKTYTQHYSGKYQATDMIIDAGHGEGFCIGNIMKLAKRFGKKDGHNRLDLLKIAHYAIITLYDLDNKSAIQNANQSKLLETGLTPKYEYKFETLMNNTKGL